MPSQKNIRQETCPPVTLTLTSPQGNSTYTYQLASFNDTWCYNVSVDIRPGAGLGLSHFVIEVCPEITAEDIVSLSADFGSGPQPVGFEFGQIKLFPPGDEPSIYGIKIEQSMNNQQSALFCINFVAGTGAILAPTPGSLFMKAGGGPAGPNNTASSTALCVPGCGVTPPPGRGILLI